MTNKKDKIKSLKRTKKVHNTFFTPGANNKNDTPDNGEENSELILPFDDKEHATSKTTLKNTQDNTPNTTSYDEVTSSDDSSEIEPSNSIDEDNLNDPLQTEPNNTSQKLDPTEVKRRLRERNKKIKKEKFTDKYPERSTVYFEKDVKEVLYLDGEEREGGVTKLLNDIIKEYYGMK